MGDNLQERVKCIKMTLNFTVIVKENLLKLYTPLKSPPQQDSTIKHRNRKSYNIVHFSCIIYCYEPIVFHLKLIITMVFYKVL